jgi:hypothetical protein
MAEAAPHQLPGALPAPFAWVFGLRHSVWLGFGAAAVFFGVGLAVIPWDTLWLFAHGTYALYFVWIALALPAFVRGTALDVAALEPGLRPGPAPLGELIFAQARRAVPAGIGIGLAIAAVDSWFLLTVLGPEIRESVPGFEPVPVVILREVIVCFLAFAILGWAVGAAHALSKAVRERAAIDLLDPTALAPLGRCGTRLALWWLLMLSLSFGPMLLPEARGQLATMALFLLGFVAMAGVALAIPTWGAHQALASTKRAELEKVRGELRQARESGEDLRIPGLVAWEQRIDAVSEWPIDARSLRLTGLYVLIPFASWIAGAMVERGIDALLG